MSDEELTSVCFRDYKKLPNVRHMSVICLTSNHPATILSFCYLFFIKKPVLNLPNLAVHYEEALKRPETRIRITLTV